MASIKITGIKELEKALKENATMDDVKRVIRTNGAQLQEKIQRNADFTKGYATGQTKRSVVMDIVDGGFAVEAGPTTEYAEYLEFGTRFMEAQPFVKPALEQQERKFKNDMKKLVRE